jgi:hypothetical protein
VVEDALGECRGEFRRNAEIRLQSEGGAWYLETIRRRQAIECIPSPARATPRSRVIRERHRSGDQRFDSVTRDQTSAENLDASQFAARHQDVNSASAYPIQRRRFVDAQRAPRVIRGCFVLHWTALC